MNFWLLNGITALGYFVLAIFGLRFASTSLGASPLWPGVGFIQAMLLFHGSHCWPGVALGIFLAMLSISAPWSVIVQTTAGNTLGAVLPALALRSLTRFEIDLKGSRNFFLFFFFMSFLGPLLSAVIGVWGFALWGQLSPTKIISAGVSFLLGDMLGSMTVGVGTLVWLGRPKPTGFRTNDLIQILALGLTLASIGGLVFLNLFGAVPQHFPLAYLVFPIMVWGAASFGQRGASAISLLVSIIAIDGSLRGVGPFGHGLGWERLAYLQTFLGIFSFTGASLAAFVEDRNRTIQQRDDLIMTAAHEFRTPLTAIQIQVDLLMRSLLNIDSPQLQKLARYLQKSRAHLERFSELINLLLDVSRARSEKLLSKKSELNLSAAVTKIVSAHKAQLREAGCELQLDIEPTTLIAGDPFRIDQMLECLLGNALKFGRGKPIQISLKTVGSHVRLSLRDYGIGISESDRLRIFEPYERAVSAHSFGGLGTGLFIAREIIKAHGGKIDVVSSIGNGSTFIVTLPSQRNRSSKQRTINSSDRNNR